jgi:chloramphenicol 3-O phosphotransferase
VTGQLQSVILQAGGQEAVIRRMRYGVTGHGLDVANEIYIGRWGMRHAVAAMAAQGLRLIIDDVVDDTAAHEYVRLLAPYRTYVVGVLASLEILECREQRRRDRVIGLARSQLAFVHRNVRYDMTIDTSAMTPTQGALQIKNQLGL